MPPKPVPLPGLVGPEGLSGDRQFAISLSRGLQLLRAFTPADTALGNRELCVRTGLPKATVSRLAYTLMMLGYLSRSADNRYALGAGVLTLGYPMLAGMRIRQIARPWLDQLARETGCTVNLGMRDRLSAVYVDSCRGDPGNDYRPDIGTVLPLLTTAIGCALLAGSPAAEQAAVLNRLRVQDPERFRVERAVWQREHDAFQRLGWCSSHGDWRPEVHAVAVPLRQSIQPGTVAVNCTRRTRGGAAGPRRRREAQGHGAAHRARVLRQPRAARPARRLTRGQRRPMIAATETAWSPETEQAFVDRVDALVEHEIGPRANAVGRVDEFAWDSFRALARAGVFATGFPARCGGTEAPLRLRVRVIESVARACSAAASMVTGVDLSGRPIAFAAAPQLAASIVPKLASGERQSAFALTERRAGSDVAGLQATARRDGGHWVLDGVKRFISRATVADLFIVVARSDGGAGAKGLTAFLVDRDTPGLRVGPVQPKLGWWGIPIAEVFLDGVRVPADRMLGAEGQGFAIAQETLVRARVGHAAMAVGRAQGAIDMAAQYVARRAGFGRRLGEHQGVQWMLADMTTQVEAARCLVRACADRYDRDDPETGVYASMAKLHAADLGMRVTVDCLQLAGGNGYLQELPFERFVRDAKLNQIGEGASEIHRNVIGRHVVKQAAHRRHPCLDLDALDL